MNILTKKLFKSVLIGVATTAAISVTAQSEAAKPTKLKIEKCYGISKKGQNECGNSKHNCAGKAKKDLDPTEWIYTLKGNCGRITGGKTKPS
ncbi:MAG: DUF2282 domain-containing protein [Gammaproteobacteria bacterium]|nr:DUF2282 domain-containing protein [Gammaproteobacteria bacterium]MCH9744660.1 DUF2282 domain-containing protein [Gammaproteobacteria bacterium]